MHTSRAQYQVVVFFNKVNKVVHKIVLNKYKWLQISSLGRRRRYHFIWGGSMPVASAPPHASIWRVKFFLKVSSRFNNLKSVIFTSELDVFRFSSQTGRLCEECAASSHKDVNFRLNDWGVKVP